MGFASIAARRRKESTMSFDTWIHLLELVLVVTILGTTFYAVKSARNHDDD